MDTPRMNQNNPFASDMVFTLSEDNDFRPAPAPQTPALSDNDWERNLNALRSRQETDHANDRASFPDITITLPSEREHNLRDLSDIYPNTNELRPFGDKELDAAYREYLSQSVAEHNWRDSITDTEVDVLIQEDWLAAQTALQSERTRRYAHETKTVLLKSTAGESAAEAASASLGSLKNDAPVALPDVAVHVYELPDLPSTRRVRVLSEQELMQGIRDKLLPHLSNAVAGMVRQALQKKLAMLSYDLQTMLNEETPQLVEDVLDHNLNAIFRSVKDAAAFKK
ncbi:hypothetical protein JDW22_04195 [Kingella sp. Marseille-Q4569]|uniref:Uncharacterized protein n=2 Tax=Kingella bonacorsii TaxID=2796361 RepID=A0ABS1BR89_9NEIS|nr:hypothetical protein [Kingella bonacorsii]